VANPDRLICPFISTAIIGPVRQILETESHPGIIALKIPCQKEECRAWSKARKDCRLMREEPPGDST
jgi:hypothetical protein